MFVWIARGLFGRTRRSSVKESVLQERISLCQLLPFSAYVHMF
jgi:hypothetical protein